MKFPGRKKAKLRIRLYCCTVNTISSAFGQPENPFTQKQKIGNIWRERERVGVSQKICKKLTERGNKPALWCAKKILAISPFLAD